MDLKDKKILVFGAGKSGIGAVSLLSAVHARPVLYDGNESLTIEDVEKRIPEFPDVPVVIGKLKDSLIAELDLCVLSPGVPTDIDPVCRIRKAGVKIWGEVELAYQCSKGTVMAVTGTNGKTTTTTLLGEIMKHYLGQDRVFVVGNIGNPYTEAALKTDENSVCVAEISSFQLETTEEFHPHVAAVTNITPDHLNRHHTMEEYVRVKESITRNQTAGDVVVLNYEDERLRLFGQSLEQRADAPRVAWFSSRRTLERGMYLDAEILKIRDDAGETEVADVRDLHLLGKHNYENICTAVLSAVNYGVPLSKIREVLLSFRSVEHRIEYVSEVNGVEYYNDSKGTNPDAAIKAVQAMRRPTVLIGGGYDKDSSYDEWIESFDGKVKALVLTGATKEKIASCAKAHGYGPVYLTDTFEEAFETCVRLAERGDAVLLSPACASWGMFPNYEVRGKVFKQLVGDLQKKERQ